LLAAISEISSTKALKFLKEMGVNVWLGTSVNALDDNMVSTSKNQVLKAHSVIWTAGVVGNIFEGLKPEAIVRGNRLLVDGFNKVNGYDNIFAIGDVAAVIDDKHPKGHAMVAPVAIQQGKLLAKNLLQLANGKPMKPFVYKDLGSMATIGRHKAVVEFGKIKSQGWLAWYIWMFVHLMSLVGFRNRVVVFVNWLWNFINYDRGVRLIIRPFVKKTKVE
jgi:NADH dehydrogenase